MSRDSSRPRHNGVSTPELRAGIERDAKKLADSNNMAAALKQAIEQNKSFESKKLGFQLGFSRSVYP